MTVAGDGRDEDDIERELLDAEEPVIEGDPPITTGDFYADSLQGENVSGSDGESG
ncbi:hypothetical protein [Nocardia rhamnosiphila]|uniref:Uncharacterized protein n=1 Tax=Nocardia rhamnosiphila TaxID=426716 RepID=A0ABV2WXR5_9NOCA